MAAPQAKEETKKLTRKESSGWPHVCVSPVKGLWKTALVHRSHGGALRSLRGCGGEDLLRREGLANQFVNFLKSLVSALGKDASVSPKGSLVFQVLVPTQDDFAMLFPAKKTAPSAQTTVTKAKDAAAASTSDDL